MPEKISNFLLKFRTLTLFSKITQAVKFSHCKLFRALLSQVIEEVLDVSLFQVEAAVADNLYYFSLVVALSQGPKHFKNWFIKLIFF